jgi:hypothetical protein
MFGLTFIEIGLAFGFPTFRGAILTPNICIIDPQHPDNPPLGSKNITYKINTESQALSAPRFAVRIVAVLLLGCRRYGEPGLGEPRANCAR